MALRFRGLWNILYAFHSISKDQWDFNFSYFTHHFQLTFSSIWSAQKLLYLNVKALRISKRTSILSAQISSSSSPSLWSILPTTWLWCKCNITLLRLKIHFFSIVFWVKISWYLHIKKPRTFTILYLTFTLEIAARKTHPSLQVTQCNPSYRCPNI